MSETNGAAASGAEAQAVAVAVEAVLAQQTQAAGLTAAQKIDVAQGVVMAWRNANLNGLPVQAFAIVNAALPDLVSAVAAKL